MPKWQARCHCACGCNRRTKYSICTSCTAGGHKLAPLEQAMVAYFNNEATARERTHCTSCGRPFVSYQLNPGDGRCVECSP